MKITIIGSETVHPKRESFWQQSCIVAEVGGSTLVFDLGYGAFAGILRSGFDPATLDAVFLTHFHPDHTSDLVPLFFTLNYGLDTPRTKSLALHGPEPLDDFAGRIFGPDSAWGEWLSPDDFDLTVNELPLTCDEPLDMPGTTVSWAKARHRPESIAYRLDSSGGSFVYTGDTEYSESVVALATGADTLLIECSAPDDSPIPGHLTPSGAARIASESGVRRVVLTHVFPQTRSLGLPDAVRAGFDGEVILATNGLCLTV